MPQLTARVSVELEADLTRWAVEEDQQRSDLIRQILVEGVDARREGRAAYSKPESSVVDLPYTLAELRSLTTELERVLRQNAKRDAELMKSAKADTLGVSDARAFIVSETVSALTQRLDCTTMAMEDLAAVQAKALSAASTIDEIKATVDYIAQQRSGKEEILAMQREHKLELARLRQQPRTHTSYNLGMGDWSVRRTIMALFATWCLCFGSVVFFSRVLPTSWVAVRAATLILGSGGEAIYKLESYQMSMATDVQEPSGGPESFA